MTPYQIAEINKLLDEKRALESALDKPKQPVNWSVKTDGPWTPPKKKLVICYEPDKSDYQGYNGPIRFYPVILNQFPEEILTDWMRGELSRVLVQLRVLGVEL